MTSLGSLLYGLKPVTVTASGVDPELFGVMTGMSFDHQACELEVFCRNPLHPGPCKGWKKTLGKIAPGALTAIEKAQKEKTAARRAARAAAKSAAEKHVAGKSDLLAHPLTAKKATIEHAETLLGQQPGKAQLKAHKTILNKQEIKKYSQLKAAQIAALAGDRKLNSDPAKYAKYLEGAIGDALAKDNVDGSSKHYDNLLRNLGEALASGLADRYCGVGSKDGDCDGLLYEGLHAHAAQMLTLSLRDGNQDRLNKLEADLKGMGDDRDKLQAYLKDKGVDLDQIKSTMYEPDAATQEAVDKLKEKLAPPKAPAPSGSKAAFEKGEKTKMDNLVAGYEAQKKAVGAASAVQLLASMTTGKKLTSAQEAGLIKNLQDAQASGTVGDLKGSSLTGLAHVFSKTETYTGVKLSNQDKARVEKEFLDALEHGTPTPLLDAIKQSWQAKTDEYGAPGKNPAGAEVLAKAFEHAMTSKPGKPSTPEPAATTSLDNPIGKALATGVNADVIKALSDHPDAWDGLSPALKEAVGQKVYTENIVGDDITKVITADLIDKHKIPHPVTGKVGGQLPEGQPPAKPAAESYEVKTALAMLGNPNASNEDKINALHDLTKEEYNNLPATEKAQADAAIKEGVGLGDPLAKNLAKQHGITGTEQIGPGAKKLNPIQEEAVALANGHKSSTAKQQVAAFENLTPDEFGELSPTTQKLIMAKLAKAKEKFLDPKKKAQAQGIMDKFSPKMGGGAGAGGSGGAVAPSLSATTPLTNEEKAAQGAAFVADAFQALGKPMDNMGKSATETVLTGLHKNNATSALDQLAESYADQLLKDSGFGLPDASLAGFAEPLKADVLEKLKATGAPTPVYDAWKNAMQAKGKSTAHAALLLLDAAALDWHSNHDGANGGDYLDNLMNAVPSVEDKAKKAAHLAEVYDELYKAAAGKAPSTPNGQLAVIQGVLDKDGMGGLTSVHPVTEQLATYLGNAHLAKIIMGLNMPTKDLDDLHNQGVFKPLKAKLIEDYADALASENSAGGIAAKLDGIGDEVNKAAADLAQKNGWPAGSISTIQFKKALFAAKVQDALKGTGPAGAGGKTTAPNPAAAVAPASSLPPVDLSGGTDIGHLSKGAKIKILGAFKGLHYAQLKDPPDKIFKNLVAVAAASSNDPEIGPVSLTQVMKAIDETHAGNLGVTNAGLLEKKIKDWLATPSGWDFAQNNAKPDQKLYDKLTHGVTLPSGVTLAPGQKVQEVGGPGGYDATQKHFPIKDTKQAIADQYAYWKKVGFTLSDDQQQAIRTYTLDSSSINFYLRGVDDKDKPYTYASDLTKQHILDLQAAMHPLQEDMSLHRGTGWEFAPKGYRSPEEFKKLIGKTLQDEAFMSSSTGGTAAFASKPVIIHFEAPAGTMALQVDPWSEFHGAEDEMLLAAGTKYKVLAVDTKNPNQTIVRVRIVS